MTNTFLAQIAPQRSTQYADLVTTLAPYELLLSPLREHLVDEPQLVDYGRQSYLKFELDTTLTDDMRETFDHFAVLDGVFHYYDAIGDVAGPLLKPLDVTSQIFLPHSLIATRRYRGKTNELFTQFMLNIARDSSAFRTTPWHKLTVLDPLSGGGTTLFGAIILGADAIGVERDKKVVDGTIGFIKQYMKEARFPAKYREDRFKNVGKRWVVTLDQSVRCVIGRGDTVDVAHFVHGLKRPQLIVTDLPYGIQHLADWQAMLEKALPAWADVLAEGGCLTFSWNATRFKREQMIDLVKSVSEFRVRDTAPYNQLAHQVDRVIKQRDVLVANL
ncbi:MAG: hypothetical protein AAFV93_04380 [Chloroflexota bacterium]